MPKTQFSIALQICAVAIYVVSMTANAGAQSRSVSAQEYIQSTSPLADGGSVTSRTAPGQKIQTLTTIAQLPSVGSQSNSPAAGYQPRYAANIVVPAGSTSFGYSASNPISSETGQRYPYPAGSTSGVGYAAPPSPLNSNATYNTAFRQSNTLGLSPAANNAPRLAQNCPTCVGGQNYVAPAFQPTALQVPAYNNTPDLNIQIPGQTAPPPGYQPNYQYQPQPAIGTPQYGAQGASWWTPFVTGSGVYTPLIKFRNMPPGTYLGQGVIGQPTAYVDGQPVRNLLRYISP